MTILDDIYDSMVTHPGLGALIGTRCYLFDLPQEPTLPAVTYLRISSVTEYSHSGDSNLQHARWQINCWAGTYTESFNVAQQVKNVLNGWAGPHGQPAFQDGVVDRSDPETGFYHIVVDAMIWWKE